MNIIVLHTSTCTYTWSCFVVIGFYLLIDFNGMLLCLTGGTELVNEGWTDMAFRLLLYTYLLLKVTNIIHYSIPLSPPRPVGTPPSRPVISNDTFTPLTPVSND